MCSQYSFRLTLNANVSSKIIHIASVCARAHPEESRAQQYILPRPEYVTKVLSFSQQYYYLSTVQFNPFRPSPSHSATDSQCFQFSLKICSRSALAQHK